MHAHAHAHTHIHHTTPHTQTHTVYVIPSRTVSTSFSNLASFDAFAAAFACTKVFQVK